MSAAIAIVRESSTRIIRARQTRFRAQRTAEVESVTTLRAPRPLPVKRMPTIQEIAWTMVSLLSSGTSTLSASHVLMITSMAIADTPANWECLRRSWARREVFFQSLTNRLSHDDLRKGCEVIRRGEALPSSFSERQRVILRAYEAADAEVIASLPATSQEARDCFESVYHAIILHAEVGERAPDPFLEQDFARCLGGAK